MAALDRTAQTNFFVTAAGGSNYLYENLFWVFGHPEVYILALPGFGIVLELLPVFARKPLWGYRLAVAGLLGVSLLSWFVWQHHLFVSGMNGDLRPFYMLSTELISIPTGFTFLCGMMTLWRGQIRFTVPMLFCLAWFFNFLIGGLSGVFLSDTPSDVTTHGSFFSMAHFHYTIMGGLVFTFFAAIYYWVPKMTGYKLNERLGEDPLLDDVHLLQLDVRAAVRGRLPRPAAPRRHLPERPAVPERLGLGLGVPARAARCCVFLFNLVCSLAFAKMPAEANPWGSQLDRVPAPVAGAGAQLRPDPGLLERSVRLRRGPTPAAARSRGRPGREGLSDGGSRSHTRAPATRSSRASRRSCSAATSSRPATCSRARPRSSSSRSSSPTSTSARSNNARHVEAEGRRRLGRRGARSSIACYVVSAVLVRLGLMRPPRAAARRSGG